MNVLIVGGGIGGLALAAFLEHSNIGYDVVEKSSDFSHQGFVIGLWDNGRDILKKLGLAEMLDKRGTRIRSYVIRDGDGDLIKRYDLHRFFADYGSSLTFVDRGELHEWLLSKTDVKKIRMGRTVERIEQREGGADVIFDDGTKKIYDAIIGADGAHSALRSLEFGGSVEFYENWRVWWTWIDDKYNVPGTLVEYIEASEFATVFRGSDKTIACFIAPAFHGAWDSEEGRVARLKRLLKDETAIIPALSKTNDADLMPSDIFEVRMRNWVSGRVALLGDAAHAFGPHAALSPSMAMEDAYVLAGELMQVSRERSVERALNAYQYKRRGRVQLARQISKEIRLFNFTRSRAWRRALNALVKIVPQGILLHGLHRLLKEEL